MSSPMQFPTPQFLAEHHQFVRRLAVRLARDEAGAEDLVQETWLAALRGGSRSIAHPRAWLATTLRRRALNAARSEGIRDGHERGAARSEAVEDERLHERVGFQQSVVAAVLALEEPYRTVVLWRYFRGWSPTTIARKRGIPAVTVRSQLARAHQQLRSRLEQRQGGREEWCFALAGFLEQSRPAMFSTPVLATAAAVCMAVAGLGAARMALRSPPSEMGELALVVPAPDPSPSPPVPSGESSRMEVASGASVSRDPVEATSPQEGPGSDELAEKSLDDLKSMLLSVEDALRPRLLTPPADVVAAWTASHPDAKMEFARILDRTRFQTAGFDSGVVGLRGGGAYYSFLQRSHSYDQEPTLGLQGPSLGAAFYGSMRAVFLALGEPGAAGMPLTLPSDRASKLEILSRGPALAESEGYPELTNLLDARHHGSVAWELDCAYVVRQFSPNEHDILALFIPIHQDSYGITVAWKMLSTWQVPNRQVGPKNTPARELLAPAAWTSTMTTEGLLLLLGRLRAATTERLMAIPDSVRNASPQFPVARVLRDYFGSRFVNIDGGGTFFNFATRSNDYQDDPDIGLGGDSLEAAGRPGLILDLGVTKVDSVGEAFTPPADERSRLGWELAWTYSRTARPPSGIGGLAATPEDVQRFRDLRSVNPILAQVGHSYLVRSVVPGEHDHLVAFEIVAEDEHGIFITWRILRTWAP